MPGRKPRAAIHTRLDQEVQELRERLGGLPTPEEADEIWTRIWHLEAHNSTALEGNTLVLQQVEQLLAEDRAVGAKTLKEYLEVRGYANAAQWVYSQSHRRQPDAPLVTVQEIRNLHFELMTPVWQVAPHPDATDLEGPGNWRQHEIEPFASGMKPPSFPFVPAMVEDWAADANRLRETPGPIGDRAADLHARFERVHPFLDGNGRAGRLLTNLLLVRLGYPPAVIEKRRRTLYLKALSAADRGDIGALGELIARAVLTSLMRFVMPAVAGEVKLLPLEALVRKDMSLSALRNAAQRGRLRAVKSSDANWRSSKRWVSEYASSRYATLRERRPT
jgi:Fic family protein